MDDDHRELVRRLFAAATELIETAHDAALVGQSGEIAVKDYAEAARRLQVTARDVAGIAGAAMIVANLGINKRRNRRKRRS